MAKLKMDWNRSQFQFDMDLTLKKFERWMINRGYRDASIDDYLKAIRLYLKTQKTIAPSIDDAKEYHSNMAASNLARATVNIRRAALLAFYRSLGQELKLPYLKPNNQVPYFFDENDIAAILNSCTNFKHYAMLNLMFHCMLRVSDLCNLEDDDIDLKTARLKLLTLAGAALNSKR